MHREYHRWYSHRLNRDMELLIFGHAGARMLVFPTSLGSYYEYEDRGMVENLREQLENGSLQLYCVDSVDAESFYCRWCHPSDRITRHMQYEDYIINEVLPLSRSKNPNPFMIAHGASFGAYHAVNIAFRHPNLFGRVLALSGMYDVSNFFDGYHDDNVYFNQPSQYVPNMHDHAQLEALRRMDIILVTGQDDPNVENVRSLGGALWDKGVGNALRVWDGWSHDWPYWAKMTTAYINGSD